MEGAIALAVLIPLAIVVLMIILLARMSVLMRELAETRRQMNDALSAMRGGAPSQGTKPFVPPDAPIIVPQPVVPPPPTPPEPKPTPPIPVAEDDTLRRLREAFPDSGEATKPLVNQPVAKAPPQRPAPPPPRPSFFERHPDLEKFIGENLINKIGIAVLVLGIGLLLKYAIGKGLISESVRTLIGLGAGGLLVFLAHRLRNSFRAFSSVLIAGGIAIFYFTIAIAFHEYRLIGQAPAFVVMVAITGLSVALSIAYDRRELAVISLLGGFAAPFLVSNGEGNYRVLFTYLLILDAGMLVLSSRKKWYVINVLSFVLTALIVGVWSVSAYTELEPRPSWAAFAFATGFFLVFFAMNLRYNLRNKQAFTALDHALLLANTGAYYAAGLHFLSDLPIRASGLFTALIGLFYLGFALYFHRREGIPRPLQLLLIGLVLTFISLAAPVQLEGSRITLFWAAEAVLLLWFSQRTGIRLVERASVLVTVLMLLSLWMDWQQAYGWTQETALRPLLNRAWIAGMTVSISLFLSNRLLRRESELGAIVLTLDRSVWKQALLVAGAVVLYLINLLEQQHQLSRFLHGAVVHQALVGYTLLFLLVLDWFARRAHVGYRFTIGALIVMVGLAFVTATYSASRTAISIGIANHIDLSFIPFHYLALALMVIAIVRVAASARIALKRPSTSWSFYLWCAATYIIVLASQELDLVMIQSIGSSAGLAGARRVGYPILWGIGSFAFMWYGMRSRLRPMRIIALTLFAITLLKLFLFDLGSLSEGGRVAAFIFLGALLLVISFMYQRLKGLFIDDVPHESTPNKNAQA